MTNMVEDRSECGDVILQFVTNNCVLWHAIRIVLNKVDTGFRAGFALCNSTKCNETD